MRPLTLVLLACNLCSLTPDARAQSTAATEGAVDESELARQASQHFERGVQSYVDRDLEGALIEFQRAYSTLPNYRLLYNLGQVSHDLRDYAAAERYYREYLRQGGKAIEEGRRAEVEQQLEKIATRIATVTLSTNVVGAHWFVDDEPIGESPLEGPIRVSAGRRLISVRAPGRPPQFRRIEIAGQESLRLDLAFPAASAAGPTPDPAPQLATTEPRSHPRPALWLGLATGATAIAAGSMGFFTYQAQQAYDDALARPTSREELDSLAQEAERKALATDILLGVTAAGAVTTLVVAIKRGKRTDRMRDARSAPRLLVGPGSVTMLGRF